MKSIAKLLCLLLALTLLSGCGRTAAPAGEPAVGIPNPQKESSEIEILTRFGTVMSLPEGGLVDDYFILEGENSTAEMRFELNGQHYTARFMPAQEYEDISGMYYEWQHTETANDLYNTTLRFNDGAEGVIDLYDRDLGLICSLSTKSGADAETLRSVAGAVFASVTDGFGSVRVDGLNALFDELREHYFPGTAGSSLAGAACAAKLADYFAGTGVDPDSVFTAVTTYASGLEEGEKQLFEQQLDGVVSSFTAITGEDGEGLLSDCGYEAQYAPWTDGNVRDCFVAMLGTD